MFNQYLGEPLKMSKYNSSNYREWYKKHKDRIRDAKKKAKKKYRETYRGKYSMYKYNSKPSTKLRQKNYRFIKRYRISLEQYEKMYNERLGSCDICHNFFPTLHVDHNHLTGAVRGLLCGSCNRALGLLKDNFNYLSNAIEYLKNNV